MKRVVKSVGIVAALLASGTAFCYQNLGDIQPFIGLDYFQAWMSGRDGYSNSFPKSYPGATLYVGTKFHENFGIELGGDWSARAKRTSTISGAGDVMVRIRRSGGHVDFV